MKRRYTSDKYIKALRTRLIRAYDMKQEVLNSILAAALSVKLLENYLADISTKHTLTRPEKHQAVLAYETREKLIDLGARFDAGVTDAMLNPKTQPNPRK